MPPAQMAPLSPPAPAPLRLAQVQKKGPEPVAGVTPYTKWLIEDVAYIIRDDERAAFKSLQSDPEREHFIEQFWQRRDPTPGTPENEFKEEHYRRIAYSNEHFATVIPGWKTDRGRIYIVYGPPDEKESHTFLSGPNSVASEQWLYHFIDGIGTNIVIEFVDHNASGEYRQTADPAAIALSRAPGDRPVTNADTPKAGAAVQQMIPGAVLISVPLTAYADHQVRVYERVVGKERIVHAFESSIQCPAPLYTKIIPIAKGTYRLEIVVKDMATLKLTGDTIEFEVK
jgi:GWxTD domain-containing protein